MHAVGHKDIEVPCPYDDCHSIRKSKLQYHITKCGKNHKCTSKKQCPFDATHIVESIEYDHHINTCPSSGNVRNSKYTLEPPRVVGTVPIEEACAAQPVLLDNEDWSGGSTTYTPMTATEDRNILRAIAGATKSKRKAFKVAERRRLCSLENNNNDNDTVKPKVEKSVSEKPLRLPKKAAKALSIPATSPRASSDDDIDASDLSSRMTKILTLPFNDNNDEKISSDVTKSDGKENMESAGTSSKRATSTDAKKDVTEINGLSPQKHRAVKKSNEASASTKREETLPKPQSEMKLPRLSQQSYKCSIGRGLSILTNAQRLEECRRNQIKQAVSVNSSTDYKDFGYDNE